MELSDREFHRLVDYMHDNFGINLSAKRVLIQGRLGNMLRDRGFTSYDQYLDAVMADTSGAEVTTILNKLTTNHTFFMREPEHYTFMKEHILPWAGGECTQPRTAHMERRLLLRRGMLHYSNAAGRIFRQGKAHVGHPDTCH